MAQKYYLPPDDLGKDALFLHFRDTIGTYATAFGLTAGQTGAQDADADYFHWLVTESASASGFAQAINAWRIAHRDGTTPPTTTAPTLPVSTAPTAVAPGIVPRFTALVGAIKGHVAYTDSIGEVLHIVGEETPPPDLVNGQPDLAGAKVVGAEVRIPWKRNGFDGIHLEVDRGTGFVFLAVDTRPGYVDTTPFPADGALWKYRAMYLLNDAKVGQWSATTTVRVG